MITQEQRDAIQQAAHTMKRRAEACLNSVALDPPEDEVVIADCVSIDLAWNENVGAFKAVMP